MTLPRSQHISSFDLAPGRVLAKKFEVLRMLGAGWEGEVYLIREKDTGIERAAKLFFPQRNIGNRAAITYARKLHSLRDCPIVIHYHTQETIALRGMPIAVLVSEYVEGELLADFLERQPGRRLHPFQALHLLHTLAKGLADIHRRRQYHGDLHAYNIIVTRHGLGFELKVLDLIQWPMTKREGLQDDICQAVRLFYDALGGARHYARQPQSIKNIIRGNKRTLVLKRFPSALQLQVYVENLDWD